MGTAFDSHVLGEDDIGVIPRAISQVFRQIVECKTKAVENELAEPIFDVGVQFVEVSLLSAPWLYSNSAL